MNKGDGKLFVGISIDNGRVKDDETLQLKTALRTIVEQFNLPIRLTGNQNLIFYDIAPEDKEAIQEILDRCGVVADPSQIAALTRYAMACPALPTCGLAITESERAIPEILTRIRALLDQLGLQKDHFVVRMTGCPNGCARPYMAELGFVGSGVESYQVWLGGSPNQTRLAQPFVEKLHHNDIESFLEPIFVFFKKSRTPKESFGDFCHRMGFDAIREFVANYTPGEPTSSGKSRHRVSLRDDFYQQLRETAEKQGRPMTDLVHEALEKYFQGS